MRGTFGDPGGTAGGAPSNLATVRAGPSECRGVTHAATA
jgi:hypothetical protein